MADINKEVQPITDGTWPQYLEEEFIKTCGMRDVKIYYYYNPTTGKLDNDHTLRTMSWLFNKSPFDPTEALSAYLSIMNVFTYPEFQNIAPKIRSLFGLRLQPTPFTDETWEGLRNFDFLKTPLSSDDKMAALAMYILLLEFKDIPSLIASAKEVNKAVGNFDSDLLRAYNCRMRTWKETSSFMTSTSYIAFSKHIYDCLIQKAVAAGNTKTEELLRLCGEKMPTIMACKTVLFNYK